MKSLFFRAKTEGADALCVISEKLLAALRRASKKTDSGGAVIDSAGEALLAVYDAAAGGQKYVLLDDPMADYDWPLSASEAEDLMREDPDFADAAYRVVPWQGPGSLTMNLYMPQRIIVAENKSGDPVVLISHEPKFTSATEFFKVMIPKELLK